MLLSVVVPVYNEAESLPLLLQELCEVASGLRCDWEVVFVDDGSVDSSRQILLDWARENPQIKILAFSRNFGHQAAITAGLDFAMGDAVVVMDADLQDPPGILPSMLELYREGYDVVSAQRITREGESCTKWTAKVFYWVMHRMVDRRMTSEVGDFRLLSRRAVVALRGFREEHRFMRGLVAWLGLREAVLPFHRRPRSAGATKYGFLRMLRFAWTAITSFSALPLRLCIGTGMILSCAGLLYLGWAVQAAYIARTTVPGWTSIVALQCLFSGIILVALGLIGEYVAKVYEESKGRPLYVVAGLVNLMLPPQEVSRATILAQPLMLSEEREILARTLCK